ncbi:RNA helicase [Sarracenia purpurea var. burkii]
MEKRNARNELVPTWMIEISYRTWTESYGSTLAYMASWLWSPHIATDHDQRMKKCRELQMRGNSLDDKKLLMLFENFVSGVCGFHKFTGSGQDGKYNEKGGRITFFTPDAAQKAVESSGVEFCGSSLNVAPARAYAGGDHRMSSFPAVRAKMFWPRGHSKGLAVVRCEMNDIDLVISDCSDILIGGRLLHCEISSKCMNSVIIKV